MSAEERAFYVAEFAGATIVVALAEPDPATVASVGLAAEALAGGGARLVLVVGTEPEVIGGDRAGLAAALPSAPVVLAGSAEGTGEADPDWMAQLWLAITDRSEVVVEVPAGTESLVGADLAAALRALKLVVTDPGGGWGRPATELRRRRDPAEAFEAASWPTARTGRWWPRSARARRVASPTSTSAGPRTSTEELFTFDGVGTLFTSGDYLGLGPLRVDDLPAVERLVAQGTADGLLRPRSRLEVARLAVTGLGARVRGQRPPGRDRQPRHRAATRTTRLGEVAVPLHREPVLRRGRRRPAGRRPGRPGRGPRAASRSSPSPCRRRRGGLLRPQGLRRGRPRRRPGGQVGRATTRDRLAAARVFLRPIPGCRRRAPLGF